MSRCGAACRGVHGRIADGIRASSRSVRTVGCSTDGHGRAAPAACFRLDAGRRVGRASPCVRPRSRAVSGTRAGGEGGCAGGQGGCPGERDGGRAGGAGAGCRAFTAGVLGPGNPCGDDAALLVSELFGNSVRHSGSGAKGETVTVAVRAVGGVVRVEVTDRGGRGLRLVAELAARWGCCSPRYRRPAASSSGRFPGDSARL